MKTHLIIPRPPVHPGGPSGPPLRIKLKLRKDHSASSYGLGVLLIGREILDGHSFRVLRERMNARIETDNIQAVAGALGVPKDESGLVEIKE